MSSERGLAGLEDALGDWRRVVQVTKGVPDTEGAGSERCHGESGKGLESQAGRPMTGS